MTEENKKDVHEEGDPFFPHHMLEQGMMILIALSILIVLVMVSPAPMEPPADPFVTPAHIKPEWYFLAAYESLKLAEYTSFLGAWAPKVLGIVAQGAGLLLLVLLPFLDRNPERNPKKRPIVMGIGALVIFMLAALTWWGWVS